MIRQRGWRPGRTGGAVAALWALTLMVLVSLLSTLTSLRSLDAGFHDILTRLKPHTPVPPGITVIDIDERSLQELGPWPWPRPVLAQLSANLRAQGASLQVWDLFMSHPTGADPASIRSLRGSDVVLGQVAVVDPAVQSPPREGTLRPAAEALPLCSQHAEIKGYLGLADDLAGAQVGHLTATPDRDGRLRRLPAVLCQGGQHYPQLALAAAAANTPGQPWLLTPGAWPFGPAQWLQRGPWRFALDDQGYLPIPFQRPHTQWPAISASQALDAQATLPIRGQVVIIGSTAIGLADTISSPFHPNAPGVSVHAELIGQARQGEGWPGLVPRGQVGLSIVMTLLLAVALVPLVRNRRSLRWGWVGFPVALVAPWAAAALVRMAGVTVPVAGPSLVLAWHAMTLLLWQAQQQRARTLEMARLLESFIPPTLAAQIAAQTPSGESLGQPCQGILLGLRIAGLDRWVSKVDSLQALALTHAIHSTVQRIAGQHGGQMEHAQGGMLFVSWPVGSAQQVAAVFECARALHSQLTPLLRQNETPSQPLSVYLAAEVGSYLLGIVGAAQGRRSVLLGPVANEVAAMLGLSEELASAILVGSVAQQVSQPTDAALRPLGSFLLPDQAHAKNLWMLSQ